MAREGNSDFNKLGLGGSEMLSRGTRRPYPRDGRLSFQAMMSGPEVQGWGERAVRQERNEAFQTVLEAVRTSTFPRHPAGIEGLTAKRRSTISPVLTDLAKKRLTDFDEPRGEAEVEAEKRIVADRFFEALIERNIRPDVQLSRSNREGSYRSLARVLPAEEGRLLMESAFRIGTSDRPLTGLATHSQTVQKEVCKRWYSWLSGHFGPIEVGPSERMSSITDAQDRLVADRERLSIKQDPTMSVAESAIVEGRDPEWKDFYAGVFLSELAKNLSTARIGTSDLEELATKLNPEDMQVVRGDFFERIFSHGPDSYEGGRNYTVYFSSEGRSDFPMQSREDAVWVEQWQQDQGFLDWKQEYESRWGGRRDQQDESLSVERREMRRRIRRRGALSKISLAVLGLALGSGSALGVVLLDRKMGWYTFSKPGESNDHRPGEVPAPLPDPGRNESPVVTRPLPSPSSKPAEASKPVLPPVIDRDVDVEGKTDIPPVAASDALKNIRKMLKLPFQGSFDSNKRGEDFSIQFLGANGYRIQAQGGEEAKNLAAVPRYSFFASTTELPKFRDQWLAGGISGVNVAVDYSDNRKLQRPTRVQLSGQLPLKELQVASVVTQQELDGKNRDVIPMDKIKAAFTEVVSLDFLRSGSFKVEPVKPSDNRWRAEGIQDSDGANVEMVAGPDGRFSIRITNDNYKLRPGEDLVLRVPKWT